MENSINIGTFIEYLTYYIKIGIYSNKGTTDDNILERCIKLYNGYKVLQTSKIGEKEETSIRKCLKRLNLILKLDEDKPVDIKVKENQNRMLFFSPHPALESNDIDAMIKYATENKIDIFTEIPLIFFLKDNKNQKIMWQYTRVLFFISQMLISRTNPDDKNEKVKSEIYDRSAEYLENALEIISQLEEEFNIDQLMSLDNFLNNRLINSGINKNNINQAKDEVKEIFKNKGMDGTNPMSKMIDSISDKLTSIDFGSGNILQTVFSVAREVAGEVQGDIEKDPQSFQQNFGNISEIFQSLMNDSSVLGEGVPSELKDMFGGLFSSIGDPNKLDVEGIIKQTGIDREDFFQQIQGENGEINQDKLAEILSAVQQPE